MRVQISSTPLFPPPSEHPHLLLGHPRGVQGRDEAKIGGTTLLRGGVSALSRFLVNRNIARRDSVERTRVEDREN